MMSRRVWVICWAGLLCFVGGCTSPEPRFYVLSGVSSADRDRPVIVGREIAVGIGPVEFPDYLDRPQIVTRSGQNEIFVADFDRWAEPLKHNATQSLAEDLAFYLGSQRVVTYPWRRSMEVDAQVIAKVIRFDRTEGADASLRVRWSILAGDGKSELLVREKTYKTKPLGDGYDATVAAMSLVLNNFAADVAQALRGLTLSRSAPTP